MKQLEIDCRIPRLAIYMCLCALKKREHTCINNSFCSYSMRCKRLGQVFLQLASIVIKLKFLMCQF